MDQPEPAQCTLTLTLQLLSKCQFWESFTAAHSCGVLQDIGDAQATKQSYYTLAGHRRNVNLSNKLQNVGVMLEAQHDHFWEWRQNVWTMRAARERGTLSSYTPRAHQESASIVHSLLITYKLPNNNNFIEICTNLYFGGDS
jgi:hypothetical protein